MKIIDFYDIGLSGYYRQKRRSTSAILSAPPLSTPYLCLLRHSNQLELPIRQSAATNLPLSIPISISPIYLLSSDTVFVAPSAFLRRSPVAVTVPMSNSSTKHRVLKHGFRNDSNEDAFRPLAFVIYSLDFSDELSYGEVLFFDFLPEFFPLIRVLDRKDYLHGVPCKITATRNESGKKKRNIWRKWWWMDGAKKI